MARRSYRCPLFLSDKASLLAKDEETSSETRTLEADLNLKTQEDCKLVLFYSLCETEGGVCRFLKSELEL